MTVFLLFIFYQQKTFLSIVSQIDFFVVLLF